MRKLEGLYLVVAPILPVDDLLIAVEKALKGGVNIVQFIPEGQMSQTLEVARALSNLTRRFDVPFLINGKLSLAKDTKADGIHFDGYDITPDEARRILGRRCLVGYTLGNDLKRLEWIETMHADYVSFCSIFQTSSSTQCEIVPIETIKAARSRTALSVFAAGGITPENANVVLEAGVDGIAVTSAILRAKNPERAAKSLKDIFHKYNAPSS